MNKDAATKLMELEEAIRQGDILKIQSETKISSLREQHLETQGEIKALGFNPEKAGEEHKALATEIDDLLAELNDLVPTDIINSYNK